MRWTLTLAFMALTGCGGAGMTAQVTGNSVRLDLSATGQCFTNLSITRPNGEKPVIGYYSGRLRQGAQCPARIELPRDFALFDADAVPPGFDATRFSPGRYTVSVLTDPHLAYQRDFTIR